MTALPLPTRHDEAWRYSDLKALAAVWPQVGGGTGHRGPCPGTGDVHEHVFDAGDALIDDGYDIAVGGGASRTVRIVQAAQPGSVAWLRYPIRVAAGGRLDFDIVQTGGRLGRIELDVELEENARFHLNAALIGGAGQTLELVTTVRHAGPGGVSRQTVRAIAGGTATVSYLGQVAVARGAQKTDAAQSVKGMLLDRTATVNAKPELEIFADDVKCAHGATVGELDAQALFYLASRGVPPAEAKALLLRAFVGGLFDHSPEDKQGAAAIDAALGRLL